jgi:hypothetical protein
MTYKFSFIEDTVKISNCGKELSALICTEIPDSVRNSEFRRKVQHEHCQETDVVYPYGSLMLDRFTGIRTATCIQIQHLIELTWGLQALVLVVWGNSTTGSITPQFFIVFRAAAQWSLVSLSLHRNHTNLPFTCHCVSRLQSESESELLYGWRSVSQ